MPETLVRGTGIRQYLQFHFQDQPELVKCTKEEYRNEEIQRVPAPRSPQRDPTGQTGSRAGGVHRIPDFSSTGLGLDHLGFRYVDVKGKFDYASDILSVYKGLADEKHAGPKHPLRSIWFQGTSDVNQFGKARTPWIVNTLA